MLKDHSPITQALLGTLFTWALTAAGAALVVVIRGKQVSTERRIPPGGCAPLTLLVSETPFRVESDPDRRRELNLTAHLLVRETRFFERWHGFQLHALHSSVDARLSAALSTPCFSFSVRYLFRE